MPGPQVYTRPAYLLIIQRHMQLKKMRYIFRSILMASALAAAVSCCKHRAEPPRFPDHIDNVVIMYMAGQNSIASYLRTNINDICAGYVPAGDSPSILLSYQKLSSSRTPARSYLIRYYSHMGTTAADTIAEYDAGMPASSAATLGKVLTDVREAFPAKSYSMLFSSHATGWLPKGYYNDPSSYDSQGAGLSDRSVPSSGMPYQEWVPYHEEYRDPSLPDVKSIGQDAVNQNGTAVSYEIDLKEFSDAIPMHLDYIFFDCCLMGGIEVAYELRDKCDRIIFSPTEVLATGFNYKTMGAMLFAASGPDLEGVCRSYYDYYNSQTGAYRSATVTLVDCTRLEPVAEACRTIFSNHREGLSAIDPDSVQRYYTGTRHWFYDLYDIACKAGADENELSALSDALEGCTVYKASTGSFLLDLGSSPGYGFEISVYSGFSMYLPCNGSAFLDEAYRSLDWNAGTSLVEG